MDDTLLKQARQLNLRNGGKHCVIPPIVLMTDDVRLPDPETAIKALPADSMVVFRHYNHPERAILGARLSRLCRARGILFLVANDLALALKLDADGIHLPEYRIHQTPQIYTQIPHDLIRTSACHQINTIRELQQLSGIARPDGVFISPIFPTQSHPGANILKQSDMLAMARLCKEAEMSPIGLGGITGKTATKLRTSALASLAGIGFSAPVS
ncbi:MAG: thiamine phosphate synthase [Thalassospira sp.]|uniref:thiamine phosphate synthase n=1 Tax=Thalassospira sp. TaxID=1912094 RepID=UPI003A89E438